MKDEDLIWKEIDKKEVYKTRVFTVTERTSISPNGAKKGVYIVNDASDWGIVIPEYQDCFLMVKQWRHGERSLSIEFPGGVIEKDEKPEDGAKRELLEETGAVAGKMIHLGSLNPNPALFSNHVHIYLAKDLTFTGKQDLDEDEFVNCIKMKKEEVFKMIGTQEFQHALMGTAAGLYLIHEKNSK